MDRFVHVFLSPIAIIDGVRNKPDFWTPILTMLLLHAAVGLLHLALVDHAYFAAEVVNAQGILMSQDQAELARQAIDLGGRTMVLTSQAGVDSGISSVESSGLVNLAGDGLFRICGAGIRDRSGGQGGRPRSDRGVTARVINADCKYQPPKSTARPGQAARWVCGKIMRIWGILRLFGAIRVRVPH